MTEVLQQAEVWTALALFVFLFFAWKPVRDGILPHLDERAKTIDRDVREVQAAYKEIETAAADIRDKMRRSDEEVREILANGKIAAEQYRAQTMSQSEEAIAARRKIAAEKISQMEIQAIEQVRAHLTRRCIKDVRDLLSKSHDKAQDHALVAASIARLSKSMPQSL